MQIPWLEPFRAAAAREAGRPIILSLATVDHLVLTSHPHRRRRWSGDGEWLVRELNP